MPVVPIGKRYGGTETFASPFGGMGLTKTENGQIVREYKTFENKYLKLKEAVMYKIDKNGNHKKIAIYDSNEEKWIKQ